MLKMAKMAKMLPRERLGASVHKRRGRTWPTGMARAKRRVG